jgi:DNA ligase (NAD+)
VVGKLQAADVNMEHGIGEAKSDLLAGLTLVVTGRLESLSRGDAEKKIKELGGTVGAAVTKKTDALVVGAEAGSKLARAEKLGVRLLDEAGFLVLIERGPAALD